MRWPWSRRPRTISAADAAHLEYGEGWLDGAEAALRLALGEAQPKATPYRGGGLPSGFTLWAKNALQNLADLRAGAGEAVEADTVDDQAEPEA